MTGCFTNPLRAGRLTPMQTTDTKAVLALVTICAALSSFALAGLARGNGGGVLSVLRSHPTHWSDREADPASVDASRVEIASAVESSTPDREERAALATLAIKESGLALYVIEGRCGDGPRGACDHGLATGPWQLHASRDVPVVPVAMSEQATIALKRWRTHRKRCAAQGHAGAFTGYGTGFRCEPYAWAREREAMMRRIAGKL